MVSRTTRMTSPPNLFRAEWATTILSSGWSVTLRLAAGRRSARVIFGAAVLRSRVWVMSRPEVIRTPD
jgi:hypothetical protein